MTARSVESCLSSRSPYLWLSLIFPDSQRFLPLVFRLAGHRSPPPHMREPPSPTNTRRSSQARDALPSASSYQSQGRYARSPSPPPERGGGRRHDIYIPSDSVPQRRQRDLDPSPTDDSSENQTKRRRVDDVMDVTSSRRGHPVDYPSHSQASSAPDAPMSILSINEIEQPRAYFHTLVSRASRPPVWPVSSCPHHLCRYS